VRTGRYPLHLLSPSSPALFEGCSTPPRWIHKSDMQQIMLRLALAFEEIAKQRKSGHRSGHVVSRHVLCIGAQIKGSPNAGGGPEEPGGAKKDHEPTCDRRVKHRHLCRSISLLCQSVRRTFATAIAEVIAKKTILLIGTIENVLPASARPSAAAAFI
jgi:hypothetical protein